MNYRNSIVFSVLCLTSPVAAQAFEDRVVRKFNHRQSFARLGTESCVADLDGDGRDDVILSVPGQSRVEVRWGVDGSVTEVRGSTGSKFGSTVACGDVDGDGSLELIVGQKGALSVYQGSFPSQGKGFIPMPSNGETFSALTLCDLNGDGAEEIVAGDSDHDLKAGFVGAYDFVSKSWLWTIDGSSPNDRLGATLASGIMGGLPTVFCSQPGLKDMTGDSHVRLFGASGQDSGLHSGPGEFGSGCLVFDEATQYLMVGSSQAESTAGDFRVLDMPLGNSIHEHAGSAPGEFMGRSATVTSQLNGETVLYYTGGKIVYQHNLSTDHTAEAVTGPYEMLVDAAGPVHVFKGAGPETILIRAPSAPTLFGSSFGGCAWLYSPGKELDLRAGDLRALRAGSIRLEIHMGPAGAGAKVWPVISLAGESLTMPVPGVTMALVPDGLTAISPALFGAVPFTADADGRVSVQMTVPAGQTLGTPLSVFFGFVAITDGQLIIANQDACSAQVIL